MFRIDRNLVNLATARSIQVDTEETMTAEAVENTTEASVPVAYYVQQQQELIKAAEVKAAEIITNARDEAAGIIHSAQKQAEAELNSARLEGYSKGAEEGKRIAEEKYKEHFKEHYEKQYKEQYNKQYELEKEKYEQKTLECSEMLKRVIGEIYTERKNTYDKLENDIVALTLEIVKKIIRPAEEEIGGVFEALIRNALRQIAPEGKVVIRVSPAEYEKFFKSGSASFELDKGVTVTAAVLRDSSLGEFDCVIDTEEETVNAGIDTQLKYIRIAFNRAND